MLVTIPTNFLWSAFSFLTLSDFEGTILNCTLKTEQRREEKQGNRGRVLKDAKPKANVENFNLLG